MANTVLTESLSEPRNGATAAKVDINCGAGNLTIDQLTGEESMLARGTLQYVENQGAPMKSTRCDNGMATLEVRGRGAVRPWFRFPWSACNGATEWQIHLNPAVSSEITAHSGGGNVRLDLAGMAVTRLSADTGGGNLEVVLPECAANLSVAAKTGAGNVSVEIGRGATGSSTVNAVSGAGNVVVHVPGGQTARIHATSGLGKVMVDPRFSRVDRDTYQSPDYDGAVDKVEITLHSGAGNVSVDSK